MIFVPSIMIPQLAQEMQDTASDRIGGIHTLASSLGPKGSLVLMGFFSLARWFYAYCLFESIFEGQLEIAFLGIIVLIEFVFGCVAFIFNHSPKIIRLGFRFINIFLGFGLLYLWAFRQ